MSRVKEASGSPALPTEEDFLADQLHVVVHHPARASVGEQVAAAATVEEVAVGLISALCRIAHRAVCQRSELHRVEVEIFNPTIVGETKVLCLDITKMERGGEHCVELFNQVEHCKSDSHTFNPGWKGERL